MKHINIIFWTVGVIITLTTINAKSQSINYALDFDGVNDWASAPNSVSLNFNTEFTVMLWTKTNDNRTAKIMEKETWNSGWTIDQDKWNGWQVGFTNNEGTRYSITWGDGVPTFNQWYHVAMVFDGDSLKLFIDGILKNAIAASSTLKTNSSVVSFASDNGSQKFYYGSIDEAIIWDIALTQNQINNIKNDYLTESNIPIDLNWNNIKGYWSFDEELTVDSIFDSSNYNNDGKMNNMEPETDRIISTIFDSESSTLPVNLLNFEAQILNNYIEISWQTGSEVNNQHFILERSFDGVEFSTFEIILGKGNSNVITNYHSKDYELNPITYYRLKQVDFDGAISISKTIEAKLTEKKDPFEIESIYIVEQNLLINFTDFTIQTTEIELFDISGKKIVSRQINQNELSGIIELPNTISKGIYIIKIATFEKMISRKIFY